MEKEIYFDNSATTPVYREVADLMHETMIRNFGNPSSLHKKGIQAEQGVNHARKILAAALEVKPEEIYFTSGGTESNNMAIKGICLANKSRGNHIITSNVEHPSVLNVYDHMEELGFRVSFLHVQENGVVDADELKELLCHDTLLVSLMHVNNESGAIQPIQEVGEILKDYHKKVYYHVDTVQSFGKLPVLPDKWGIDMLSVSGHKLHGSKGSGVLYLRKGTRIKALVEGGGQEKRLRSGTENVPGIVGLGKAVELAMKDREEHVKKMAAIRETLASRIKEQVPDCKINSNFDDTGAPHILNISFPGIKSEVLLHYLEQDGIYVSSGSACSARKGKLSHVLTAMHLTDEEMEGSIRFSFSYMNELEEVVPVAESVGKAVRELQQLTGRG
ncbi:cysteine desulfurase family protein [Dehalobacterium formicoaceticum]|uniref:Cysteine desulfurase n=1 Tax=Dehalobacterium formicoaceticum TaxID=51515 RepID=A0ABT1Y5G0_9FIRM|nr:cysteine desulfurase family protein [Dehalobacterium formicoaceticum]MCR6545154.1 cysteine desulfurase [Dehalobacterium formicoaceticum]